MTGPTPTDPADLRPIRQGGRRWMVGPAVLVVLVVVAIAKPWGDVTRPPASPVAVASIEPTASAVDVTASLPLVSLPAAADVIASFEVASAPWSNELAVATNGAWAWSDAGTVMRIDAATGAIWHIDLGSGSSTEAAMGPLGSRGIAVARSQVWASDPAHRGLARIDPTTGAIAQRVTLWPAGAAGGTGSPRPVPDPWASAWGFAIAGNAIFVPSIMSRPGDVVAPAPASGELWRVDTSSAVPPSWISIDAPTGVAVGFGSVWVASCCGRDGDVPTYSIVRLEQETGGVQASISLPVPRAEPDDRPVIRVGPDSVWVGLTDMPLVVRIDPATNGIRSTLPMALPVSDLAIGDDGSIWVTESEPWYRVGAVASDRCEGYLVRIDPADERQVAATAMACPMSVAVSDRDVWVGSAGTEGSLLGRQAPSIVHLRATDPPA